MNYKKIEKIIKGASSFQRIKILDLLSDSSCLSLGEISFRLKVNLKTLSAHIKRMEYAGLVFKNRRGKTVEHELTPLGRKFSRFLRELE